MKELEPLKRPLFWMVLGLALIWVAIFQLPDNRLHLVFCDVGQGDAILVSFRSTQVLIDGGPNRQVLQCLSNNLPFWDRTIEMVVLTHPQADHFTGLIDVIERYDVKQFVVNSIINDSSAFWKFYQAVLGEKAKIYSPQAGDKIHLGPMQFLVLWPKERLGDGRIWLAGEVSNAGKHLRGGLMDSSKVGVLGTAAYSADLNETSIVLQFSFGNFDALLTGDISCDIERQISWSASQGDNSQIEVLKVAHHGSKYSTSQEFLEAVRSRLAVISVGKNRFGHPAKEAIEKLSNLEIEILRTDQEGEIEIVSDGQRWGLKK